jgi:hypothetical protein
MPRDLNRAAASDAYGAGVVEARAEVSVPLPATTGAVPRRCDWSVVTRPVAPNTIASVVVEVRVCDGTIEIWADGRRVAAGLVAGDTFALGMALEGRPARGLAAPVEAMAPV